MKPILTLIFTLTIAGFVQGQMLNITSVTPWSVENSLSPKFVRTNSIQQVEITQMIKREGGGIDQVLDQITLQFHPSGRVASMEEIRRLFGKLDSTRTDFFFDPNGKLRSREEFHQGGHLVYMYTYDSENRPTGSATDAKTAHTGQDLHIQDEVTRWRQINDTLVLGTTYNNLDLPYKEVRLMYNYLGYLVSSTETQLMTRSRITETFDYNHHGLLAVREVNDPLKKGKIRESYTYDERGHLTFIDVKIADVGIRHYEIVYSKDLLVEGILVQDLLSLDIQIFKFTYTFLPN
jgi:hypothetical protein